MDSGESGSYIRHPLDLRGHILYIDFFCAKNTRNNLRPLKLNTPKFLNTGGSNTKTDEEI